MISLRRAAGGLLAASFLIFAAMAIYARFAAPQHGPVPDRLEEQWRPDLASVRSIDAAMTVLPAYIARQQGSREARIAAAADEFVRDRFFHQRSLLGWRENWLAALAGYAWLNLRVPVLPDEILHHRRAICSQQAIVFMELLRRYGVHRAAVTMYWPAKDIHSRGHFAAAAKVDGRWMFYDPDQEAAVRGVSVQGVVDGTALDRLYGAKPELLANMHWAAEHREIRLQHIDSDPAPRGGLFQRATARLSAYGWMPLGLLALGFLAPDLRRRRRRAPWSAALQPAE